MQIGVQNVTKRSDNEQVNYQWYEDEVRFVLDQHAKFEFYSASSLKQQSAGRHNLLSPLQTMYICIHFVLPLVYSFDNNNIESPSVTSAVSPISNG
jgi:hypothetical protein